MKDYPKVVFLYITEEDEFTGLNNVVAVFPERRRQDDIEYIRADIHEDEIAKLKAALEEILKGEGAFSMDKLTHAGNVIENMKDIAYVALGEATND